VITRISYDEDSLQGAYEKAAKHHIKKEKKARNSLHMKREKKGKRVV
jgi:hypothetical protein